MEIIRSAVDLLVVILALVIIPLWFSPSVRNPPCQCSQESSSKSGSISVSRVSDHITIKDSNESTLGSIFIKGSDSPGKYTFSTASNNCVNVVYKTDRSTIHHVSSGVWYGGPQYYTARWPLSREDVAYQHYVSDDLLLHPGRFGSILERYWLSSSGIAIYFPHDDVDLYYGVEHGDIKIGSMEGVMDYFICKSGSSLKETHEYMIKSFFRKPTKIPDVRMLQQPIWSTWVRYKTEINETIIISFAQEITDHGFKCSQLEIDDTYTTNYGDMQFDPSRFPNPKQMLQKLKQMDYRVTSWVHPFVNYDTAAFQVANSLQCQTF